MYKHGLLLPELLRRKHGMRLELVVAETHLREGPLTGDGTHAHKAIYNLSIYNL